MKTILNILLIVLCCIGIIHAAPLSDELVVLHGATTAEMNTIASPIKGSLIFNTDDNELYEHNTTAWHKISSDGRETFGSTLTNNPAWLS